MVQAPASGKEHRSTGTQRESLGELDLPFLLSSESSRGLIATDSILEGRREAQPLTLQQHQPPAQLPKALTRTEQKAEPSSALNQHLSRLWLGSAPTTRSRWGPTTFLHQAAAFRPTRSTPDCPCAVSQPQTLLVSEGHVPAERRRWQKPRLL